MQTANNTYLYQYKNSSNYFFRTRFKLSEKVRYDIPDSNYFVASLGTSDYDDARWLAMYIKRNLIKEGNMEGINTFENSATSLQAQGSKQANLVDDSKMNDLVSIHKHAAFREHLKKKFNQLLNAGKHLLEFGIGDGDSSYFSPLTSSHKSTLRSDLEQVACSDEQQASLNWVNDKDATLLTGESRQYAEYVGMLDALVEKMSTLQSQVDSYTSSFETIPTTNSELANFSLAMAQHKSVKDKLESVDQVKRDKAAHFYSLGHQFDMFIEEQKLKVNSDTVNDYLTRFKLLFDLISRDFDCRAFGKMQVQEVKSMLLNRRVSSDKKSKSTPLSAKTINSYLSNYRTLFTWLSNNVDGVDQNPFAKVSVKSNELVKIRRRSLKPKEVARILGYTPFHGSEARLFRRDAKWFIPVALYSGMRLNEVSEIRLSDIKQIDEVWCFDLQAQDVKNISSRRVVPIAQYLLDLGFLDYVAVLKKEKQTVLFPQIRESRLKPGKTGWGDSISRWFNRTVLKNIGIDIDEELRNKTSVVFHCLRHTFISTCIKSGEQKHLVKRIVGHAQDDEVTLGVYSNIDEISLKLLKEVIDRNLVWHLDK